MYAPQGFGDAASCPSYQQLLGITDPTDPCQTDVSMITPAAAGQSCYPPTFVGPLPPGGAYCSQPAASGCPAGSNCTFFANIPNSAIYTLAAVLAGLFVVSTLGHK